jgi:hypothetical protein
MRTMHRMTADTVTFGVELETVVPAGALQIGGYHNGLPVTAAPAFNGTHWRAERDGSIVAPAGYVACEFVSPVLSGPEGVRNLVDMVAWIREVGGRVNPSCGCHVHVGVASVLPGADPAATADYIRRLAGVVNINAEALYAQTGTRRDLSRYTRRLSDDIRATLDLARREGDPGRYRCADRYRVLNVTNVTTRGTVEFRAFAGTLSTEKVLHHLWTCLFMCVFARELQHVPWTGHGWASMAGGNGEKALRGLHRKMGLHCLVGDMGERRPAMKAEALRLARKFDSR